MLVVMADADLASEVANARLNKFAKPTIARIRGYCIGGGLAVALLCDIRIASDVSKFGVPAARLGLGYRASGLKILTDLVGPSHAKEIFFTARHFSAPEAFGMGLITRIVPDAELDSYVDNYCKLIGENAPLTMHAAKRTIEELTRLDGKPDFDRLLSAATAVAIGPTTARALTDRGHTPALAESAELWPSRRGLDWPRSAPVW